MRKEVRLFARLREVAARDLIGVDLPESPTIADLSRAIADQHPTLAPFLEGSRFAAAHAFVDVAYRIGEGDELAVIPPVSGG